jgi:hypothetical protein
MSTTAIRMTTRNIILIVIAMCTSDAFTTTTTTTTTTVPAFVRCPKNYISTAVVQRTNAVAVPLDFPENTNARITPTNSGTDSSKAPKVGVLLLNLGGPETGDDVEGTVDMLHVFVVVGFQPTKESNVLTMFCCCSIIVFYILTTFYIYIYIYIY